jgi:hypothetical protein
MPVTVMVETTAPNYEKPLCSNLLNSNWPITRCFTLVVPSSVGYLEGSSPSRISAIGLEDPSTWILDDLIGGEIGTAKIWLASVLRLDCRGFLLN